MNEPQHFPAESATAAPAATSPADPTATEGRGSGVPVDVPPSAALEWAVIVDGTDEAMAARGLHRARTLVQLRRPLPLEDGLRRTPAITTRPFRPGVDDDDFLAVNNAAFWWHPEQGAWDHARLAAVLAEDWVDLDGFLVHDGPDGRVDGYCWTRIHPATATDPALGEISAIAAAPSRHGTGLGSALVVAGLDHLHRDGLAVAMLFAEEDNQPAHRMYERLGFRVHERRGGYR